MLKYEGADVQFMFLPVRRVCKVYGLSAEGYIWAQRVVGGSASVVTMESIGALLQEALEFNLKVEVK